jgi:hypothetical protein
MSINFQPILRGNLPEQDHIFSRSELSNADIPIEKINSIYNIRFIGGDDNRRKLDTPYEEWTKDLGNNKEMVFERHFIPAGEWSVAKFYEFLEARKVLMLSKLQY